MEQEQLTAIGLDEAQCEQVLTLFQAERDALAAAQEEAMKVQSFRQRLRRDGVSPAAAKLLMTVCDTSRLKLHEGELTDDGGQLSALRQQYPGLFPAPIRMPQASDEAEALPDEAAINAMSAEEINRRWHSIKSALAQG